MGSPATRKPVCDWHVAQARGSKPCRACRFNSSSDAGDPGLHQLLSKHEIEIDVRLQIGGCGNKKPHCEPQI